MNLAQKVLERWAAETRIPSKYKKSPVFIERMPTKGIATWWLNDFLEPVIILDKPFRKAIKEGKISKELLTRILEHEYKEALLAIQLAKKDGKSIEYMLENYTGQHPRKEREIDQFGGLAHDKIKTTTDAEDSKKLYRILYGLYLK